MLCTKEVPYVYAWDSIYYFNRRIPKDLQRHYRCDRIIVSLHTKSPHAAKTKSVTLAAQLDVSYIFIKPFRMGKFLQAVSETLES